MWRWQAVTLAGAAWWRRKRRCHSRPRRRPGQRRPQRRLPRCRRRRIRRLRARRGRVGIAHQARQVPCALDGSHSFLGHGTNGNPRKTTHHAKSRVREGPALLLLWQGIQRRGGLVGFLGRRGGRDLHAHHDVDRRIARASVAMWTVVLARPGFSSAAAVKVTGRRCKRLAAEGGTH